MYVSPQNVPKNVYEPKAYIRDFKVFENVTAKTIEIAFEFCIYNLLNKIDKITNDSQIGLQL